MTVYAVSQEYLDEMNEPFILPAFAEAELLNLDAAAQAQVSISTYTGALTGCQTGNIVKVSAEHVDNFATLEPDRMTADGSYGFVPPFYVSSALSASSQDSNGGYAISNVSVTLSFAEGLYIACPLTLVIPAAARISVEISYGYIGNIRTFSKTYDVDADTVTLTDLPDQELYRSVKITVSALRKPQWRAHIRKVYFGTIQVLENDDIRSLAYTDTSDGMMLELPQRKATLAVSNADGKYNPITENENPSFKKWYTQATLRIGQDLGEGDVEWIPLGRFFMESYTVTEETVTFVFQSALGLLNDFTYFWERNIFSVSQKIDDVFYLDTDMVSNGTKPKTTAEAFALTIDKTAALHMNESTFNSGPLVSSAAFLQLLANVTGNLIRPKRVGEDMELIGIPTDTAPVRTLREDRCFDGLNWTAPERIGTVTVNYMWRDGSPRTETLAENAILSSQDLSLYYTQGEIIANSIVFDYDPSAEDTPYVADTFVHTIYAGVGYKVDNLPGVSIQAEAHFKKAVNAGRWVYGDGKEETFSNHFISSTSALSASSFAGRLYDEMQNNIIGTLSHRGYPEIDAGDIIRIDDSTNGNTRARVLENTLTMRNGVLSGTTKVRRLYGGV